MSRATTLAADRQRQRQRRTDQPATAIEMAKTINDDMRGKLVRFADGGAYGDDWPCDVEPGG